MKALLSVFLILNLLLLTNSCTDKLSSSGINDDIKKGVSIAHRMEDAMKIAKTGNPKANQIIKEIENDTYIFLAKMRVKYKNDTDYQKINDAIDSELERVMENFTQGY